MALILSLIVVTIVPRDFFPGVGGPCFHTSLMFPRKFDVRTMSRSIVGIRSCLGGRRGIGSCSIALNNAPLHCCLTDSSFKPGSGCTGIVIRAGSPRSTTRIRRRFCRRVARGFPGVVAHSTLFTLSPIPRTTVRVNFVNRGPSALATLIRETGGVTHRYSVIASVHSG